MRKSSRLASRMRAVYIGIPAVAVVLMLLVGLVISRAMADEFSRQLSRQYSIEAAANFLTATNAHFVLAQQLAHSTTISRWMANEDDPVARANAIEEIMGYAAFAPYISLMFTVYDTRNVYDLRAGFTEEDFFVWWQIFDGGDGALWFTNTRDAELPFNLNIQRTRPVDGQWSMGVWTNHRMYYNGEFIGVVTAGSPFDGVFDAVFAGFDRYARRGYIIDYNGLARADSSRQLVLHNDGLSAPAPMPEALAHPALAAAVDAHLRTMQNGAFQLGMEVGEALSLPGEFRYASISPIIGTNWSVVVFSNDDNAMMRQLVPFFVVMIIILTVSMAVGSLLVRRFVLNPLFRLTSDVATPGAVLELERADEIGELARAIRHMSDEIHRHEEAQRAHIEESNQAKSRFLARMSHEIRTPITAVLGISEIHLRSQSIPDGLIDAFDKIYTSSKTLLNIVNHILDFSKIESGKMTLNPTEYETASLLDDVSYIQFVYLEHKPIAFNVQVDANLPVRLLGDALRIRQLIINALTNAFKYTESGAVDLIMTCEPAENGRITLLITVRDTGLGMTPEQIALAQEEYNRFHEHVMPAVSGTGLGMPIVSHIARLMDAQLDIESALNQGTTITLRIPQDSVTTELLGTERAQAVQKFEGVRWSVAKDIAFTPAHLPHGKVLVVDDIDTNLYVAEAMLASFGVTITLCTSGQEALDNIAAGNTYDIIFMDHMMPDPDGIATTCQLRQAGYTQPIVALTANAIKGNEALFLENGFDAYMTKPIDIEVLGTMLLRFISEE